LGIGAVIGNYAIKSRSSALRAHAERFGGLVPIGRENAQFAPLATLYVRNGDPVTSIESKYSGSASAYAVTFRAWK
jgi:hypothetical protein